MWVLILAFMTVSGNSGVSLTSATYQSEAACRRAGDAAKSGIGGMLTTVRYICTPQGDQ